MSEHYAPPTILYSTLEDAYMKYATPESEPDELWVSRRDFETILRMLDEPVTDRIRIHGLCFNAAKMLPKGEHGCEMAIYKDGVLLGTELICGPALDA